MAGSSTTQEMFCPVQNARTVHYTEWSSEEPNVIQAQCSECFPGRMVSGYTVAKKFGRMTYYIMNKATQFKKGV